ncbi:MAG TPA: HEAT repeat domain-containing protein, partial [Pyrinomonadaceae bacterium]
MPSSLMGRHFRHTVRTAAFCAALLVGGFLLLFHTSAAKSDPIAGLLRLPAPAPPNPLVHSQVSRVEKLNDPTKPPDDNAPIEELINYWTQENSAYNKLRYNAEPSDRTRDRLLREVQENPKILPNVLNTFNDDLKAAGAIYEIYNREGATGAFDRDTRKTIRSWLTYHSPYFSQELEAQATLAGDTTGYVSNQEELLALTRVDFDRARPIIDRLYDSPDQKVGRVLAQWALYRRGLDSGSSLDADRYRKELQDVVEDKNALPGARDLALDALAQEKDWPGGDEWYLSLLGDASLSELKVNGQVYTGLTTQMLVSPPGKYVPRMIELLKSNDPVVRGNIVRNLVTQIETGGPDVVRALLPWLEDEKWAKDTGDTRAAIVRKLAEIEMPESVPGLIKVLEEKRTVMVPKDTEVVGAPTAMNAAMANAAAAVANAMAAADNAMRYAANSNAKYAPVRVPMVPAEQYPYRSAAVYALTKQKDPRAVPALKRTLYSIEGWERESVVKAIFVSGGFTLSEQLDALETAARGARNEGDFNGVYSSYANAAVNAASAATNTYSGADYANTLASQTDKPLTPLALRQMLGQVIMTTNDVSDELARAVVDRIEDYDKRDPAMA